jgi:hypothetical protein
MYGNPWFAIAAGLVVGGPLASGDQLRATARALVLLGLERGPRAAAELPRAWPVTRVAILAAVRDALAGRLCEPAGDARGRVRITPRGRRLLESLRARRAVA